MEFDFYKGEKLIKSSNPKGWRDFRDWEIQSRTLCLI